MDSLIIGQITDMHIKAGGKLSYRVVDTAGSLRRCVEHVLGLKQQPDFIVFTGDLVDFGRLEEYEFLRELLAPLPMPYYLVPGNHDEREAMRAAFTEHRYLRQWAPYIQYTIEDWPLRIVALDTVIPGEERGQLCKERLEWLDARLAEQPERPTMIVMHHPPFKTWIGHMDQIGLEGADHLEAAVSRHPQVERVLCGHLHRPIQARFACTVASTCPSPSHQVALDLAEDAPSRFMLEPAAYQLHAWSPKTGVVSHTSFVGNFDGPYPFFAADGSLVD